VLKLCWLVTAFGASGGMLMVIDIFMRRGASAPQEAAGAAIACALCVVPYVFTRAVEGLKQSKRVEWAPPQHERPMRDDSLVDPLELLNRGR